MKERLAKSSPSKFTKETKEALKNKKEKSDKTKKYNSIEKKYIKKYGQSTSKGKVPATTNSNATVITKKVSNNEATKSDNTKTKNISFKEAQSKGALKNTAFNLVPDAFQISNYIKDRLKSNKKEEVKKIIKVADKKPQPPTMSQSVKDKRAKTKASASNTKNFASTMDMQKKLKKMGADIETDGIMGPKTRAAMKKYLPKKTFNAAFSNKKLTTQERLKEIDKEKANPKKKRAKFNKPKTKQALAEVLKMLKKNKK